MASVPSPTESTFVKLTVQGLTGTHIKAKDITIKEGFMSIQIPQSKIDQLRKGNKVVISQTGSKLCLVSIIEKYMALFSLIYISPIARSVRGGTEGEWLLAYLRTQGSGSISMDELGFPSQLYGLHSFHSGRGPQWLQQWGPKQVHGRWQSETAKDKGYCSNLDRTKNGHYRVP